MRVAIVGLGLIGGSLALALRGGHDVAGFDNDPATRARAGSAGIRVVDSLDGLGSADATVVATPLSAVIPTLDALTTRPDAGVLIDTGSLKRDVAAYAEKSPQNARIVGGHPMAGTTSSGFGGADPDLFRGRPFLLVPTARSDDGSMSVAGALARAVGAEPTVCSAAVHDRTVAMLSAVPLAVALALAKSGADVAAFAGPGFRDATRLAATPPELTRALLGGNRDEVKAALRKFRSALDEVEAELG
ncbi:MAG: prephenate dehydrogenase/arogenate dehydrogenase family protein [Chloroflexi bacterium]|nr:prephenate dehydrogenase/arogenate dehydrogenase family protein [Chloroflexota bacterium]